MQFHSRRKLRKPANGSPEAASFAVWQIIPHDCLAALCMWHECIGLVRAHACVPTGLGVISASNVSSSTLAHIVQTNPTYIYVCMARFETDAGRWPKT